MEVSRENVDSVYQDLWQRCCVDRQWFEEGVLAAIAHCDSAAALYGTDNADDKYRQCMWQRRAILHRQGRHFRVWNGDDPVVWRRLQCAGFHFVHGAQAEETGQMRD